MVRKDLSDQYNPLHPETLLDPFATYQRLRLNNSIFWHEDLFAWVLLSHKDCSRVLKDHILFTRDRRKLGRTVPMDSMNIQSLDPPEQIPLREALMKAMRKVNIAKICQDSLEVLWKCLKKIPSGHSFDFMSQVAAPTATNFACHLVGLQIMPSDSYSSLFLRLTKSMDSVLNSKLYSAGVEATNELNDLIEIARYSPIPGSIMYELTSIASIKDMSTSYVRNTLSAVFNAAYSTAYSSMGSFLTLAVYHNDLAKRIVDTGNISLGVHELLRYTSPAQSTRRFATCDLIIGDASIKENDPILTVMAAANRDPEVFKNPDELILNRSPNPHLSFGLGPHYCAGSRPALLFLETFVHSLAKWERSITLVKAPIWLDTFTLRCIENLQVIRRD